MIMIKFSIIRLRLLLKKVLKGTMLMFSQREMFQKVVRSTRVKKIKKDNQVTLQFIQICVVVLIFIKFNFYLFFFFHVRTLFILVLLTLFVRIMRMTNFKILEREPRFSLVFI
ncbi:hypothetical protein TorRG33x02_264910 [Trema orientale]|uniref:Transmembrane protein n=1 Tax=Trema orientale TaxID=63057 RepID=A0A2P5D210_TREOI|nr:hypothetical protein TorRG33x02_264910 [Trema orientale]